MKALLFRCILRESKLQSAFPVDSRWKHYSGKIYRIVGVANTANMNPKYRPVIVFRSEVNQNLWTKTPKRFLDTMTKL